MITEILGDSIRQDLNFVASKINDLPINSTLIFVSLENDGLKLVRDQEKLSLTEIDLKNEKRYKFTIPKREDLKIYFYNIKNLDEEADFIIVLANEKDREIEFKKLLDFSKKKIFFLTVLNKEPNFIKEIREKNKKELELIQLSVPENWIRL